MITIIDYGMGNLKSVYNALVKIGFNCRISGEIKDIEKSDILDRLELTKNNYFVVSSHREENISSEANFLNLVDSLNTIAENYQLPIIISTHPRTMKMIETKGIKFHKLVQTMKPMGFNDYNKLQINAKAVLSDSGTISEESFEFSCIEYPSST